MSPSEEIASRSVAKHKVQDPAQLWLRPLPSCLSTPKASRTDPHTSPYTTSASQTAILRPRTPAVINASVAARRAEAARAGRSRQQASTTLGERQRRLYAGTRSLRPRFEKTGRREARPAHMGELALHTGTALPCVRPSAVAAGSGQRRRCLRSERTMGARGRSSACLHRRVPAPHPSFLPRDRRAASRSSRTQMRTGPQRPATTRQRAKGCWERKEGSKRSKYNNCAYAANQPCRRGPLKSLPRGFTDCLGCLSDRLAQTGRRVRSKLARHSGIRKRLWERWAA